LPDPIARSFGKAGFAIGRPPYDASAAGQLSVIGNR